MSHRTMTPAAYAATRTAAIARWASMTPEQRAVQIANLQAGRAKGKARNTPRVYMTKRTRAVIAAVRAIHDKGLPRPPLMVLAKLAGYPSTERGGLTVCQRIADLKTAGLIREEWWPRGQQPSRKKWADKLRGAA